MPPQDWTPHRRDDGELLGWIRPEGGLWVAVDVLGRRASGSVEWLDAESALDEHGLAWLAEPWMLDRDDGRALRVRIVEVIPGDERAPGRVRVKADDFGDVSRPAAQTFTLPWPAPGILRPPRADDPDAYTLNR